MSGQIFENPNISGRFIEFLTTESISHCILETKTESREIDKDRDDKPNFEL